MKYSFNNWKQFKENHPGNAADFGGAPAPEPQEHPDASAYYAQQEMENFTNGMQLNPKEIEFIKDMILSGQDTWHDEQTTAWAQKEGFDIYFLRKLKALGLFD